MFPVKSDIIMAAESGVLTHPYTFYNDLTIYVIHVEVHLL
jgi:hypothetical protein